MFSLAGEFVQTSGPVLPPDCQPRHSLPGFGVSVALAPCGPHRGPVRLVAGVGSIYRRIRQNDAAAQSTSIKRAAAAAEEW